MRGAMQLNVGVRHPQASAPRMSTVAIDSPQIAAAAVVLLSGWMSAIEVPAVFSPPQFRLGGAETQGLLASARILSSVVKPVRVRVEVLDDQAALRVEAAPVSETWTRRAVVAAGRVGRGRGDPRLWRERAAPGFGCCLRADRWCVRRGLGLGGRGRPSDEPPRAVQYLAQSDREAVAWFLQLGAWRGDRSSSPVWLAAEPPLA